ncbi:unnamed protein product [Urochloa decumbens]|uniref:[RNA-polymerase]-subunit kinase n=1 Tax=Urochloa decumbens TaxID=240449 RepID=A0ABC8WYN1_9POAL
MAAACVEAAPAPAAGVARRHAAAQPARKRMRVAMGTTEDYDYEDACRLGEGAFGAVIRARHRGTGRSVAMKYLGEDGGGQAELLRESLLLEAASKGNPFVVASRGLARDPATADLCLVMDCGGATLRDALRRQPGPLPESTVRAAMWQLLEGAKRMHAAHIVHRDIKPHNILLGDDRVLRFCDFGLAVHMSEPPPYGQAGTLWYMAPEVLLGMPDYDALVDAWSLGCVMAQLLGGEAPLQGADEDDQLSAIFGVLGYPDDAAWPWFWSTRFAAEMPEMDKKRCKTSVLRCKYPETKLSEEGFQVLSGLLTCNPNKRLTAAAALKHPWFSRMDEPELPNKEVVPPLTKRQRLR